MGIMLLSKILNIIKKYKMCYIINSEVLNTAYNWYITNLKLAQDCYVKKFYCLNIYLSISLNIYLSILLNILNNK